MSEAFTSNIGFRQQASNQYLAYRNAGKKLDKGSKCTVDIRKEQHFRRIFRCPLTADYFRIRLTSLQIQRKCLNPQVVADLIVNKIVEK
jgi:hypothetical protein